MRPNEALKQILTMDSCLLADAQEIAKGAIDDMSLTDRVMKDARSGKTCVGCGRNSESVCGRHYNGQRQHQYGKGRGIKCHPFAVADLCNACDALFQEGTVSKSNPQERDEYSETFLHYCMISLIRREQEGFFD